MTETELVNAKGFRYGATACQDAASLMDRIAAKPRGPDIGVLCLGPGQPTRWGAGRFRMGDARPSAGLDHRGRMAPGRCPAPGESM
jgi:hypothetical protein